jgi:hypothetical protein
VVIDVNGLQLIHFKPYCEFKKKKKNLLGYDDLPSIFFKGTHIIPIVPSGGDPASVHCVQLILPTRVG